MTTLLGAIAWEELLQMEREGLVRVDTDRLVVTTLGKAFIRNICMVFDLRHRNQHGAGQQVFSKAI